jgi:hypothetical protein
VNVIFMQFENLAKWASSFRTKFTYTYKA